MKQDTATARADNGQIPVDTYAGVGWLLLSIVLFGLVFLPMILL